MTSREGDKVSGAAASAAPRREGVFDHAVLNLHYDLDAGEDLFRSLGFNITPRGYHTLGSMNHLIVFGTDYFELVGIDPNNPNPRKELLDWPVGLNGLVYGSDDIEVTHARLKARQLPVLEPKSFSRPVTVDGAEVEASFRTAHMAADYFPASRLYFCEHRTPELVWHNSFMRHANTADSIRGIMVAADDPEAQADRLARALGVRSVSKPRVDAGGVRIDFASRRRLAHHYLDHVCLDDPLPRIVGVSIGVRSLSALKASLHPRWTGSLIEPDRYRLIVPAAKCFGVMIEFLEPNASLV